MKTPDITQIASLAITGLVVYFSLKNERIKHRRYFGQATGPTRKERIIIKKHKDEYIPINFDYRFPSFDKDGFELEDIAKSATEIVYDNPLPTRAEKINLAVGELVKLKFIDKDSFVERMWVEITKNEDDLFEGIITNDSLLFSNIPVEKKMWFHTNHIFEIYARTDRE